MSDALQYLLLLDHDAIRATAELRWGPATAALTLMSAWWVKGPVLVGVGWCSDLRRRRVFPLTAAAATASFFLASWLNWVLKALVDRGRPPEEIDFQALVGVPSSPSFPSGHAMSAFAVAGAIAVLSPRLRWPVLGIAAVIAFSRVYLGVHFWIDVLVGAALGLAVGVAVARSARRLWEQPRAPHQRHRERPDLPAGDRAERDVEREVRSERHPSDRDRGEVREHHVAEPRRHPRGGDDQRGRDDQVPGRERGDVRPVPAVAAGDLGPQGFLRPLPVDRELDDLEHDVGEDGGEQHRQHGAHREAQAARTE
jgi:membrane-associated phospholipid phosphatase